MVFLGPDAWTRPSDTSMLTWAARDFGVEGSRGGGVDLSAHEPIGTIPGADHNASVGGSDAERSAEQRGDLYYFAEGLEPVDVPAVLAALQRRGGRGVAGTTATARAVINRVFIRVRLSSWLLMECYREAICGDIESG